MKYAQVRLQFEDGPTSPVQAALSTAGVRRAQLRFGGVATSGPRTYVLSVTGDPEAVGEAFDSHEGIHDHELVAERGGNALVYVRAEASEVELAMQATFTQGSLVTPPPLDFCADGSIVVRVLGETADLQAAVEAASDRLAATVERIAEYDRAFEGAAAALTDRQREAVRAALAAGYYAVPREADHADVAAELDCAPATAGEHLQKAEAALVRAVFGRGDSG